ncbi:MAG: arginine repressor [Bacteroidota bacterium]
MTKRDRQLAIKDIIRTQSIASQDDLRRQLKKRGVVITQATLSRDLTELGISRIVSEEQVRYALQPGSEVQNLKSVIVSEVQSILANETSIIIHTLPGCAHVVGEYVDIQNHPDVLGTIAGDNTLIVIPSSIKKTRQLAAFLKRTFLKEG